MSAPRLVAHYASADQFLQVFRTEMVKGGVLIHGVTLPPTASVGPCVVEVRVGALAPLALDAQIAASIPGVGVAVMFPEQARLQAFAESVQAGTAPLRRRKGLRPRSQRPRSMTHRRRPARGCAS